MAEYKNGFNAFGGIPVDSSRLSSDVQTGRAVYVNEDEYSDEPDYKNRVDQTVNEGYHREAPFEAPEIVVPEPIIPSGTKNITENGVYDVARFAKANVNVAGGGSSDFSTAEVTITVSEDLLADEFHWLFPIISSDKVIVGNYVQEELTETHSVALYKGECEISNPIYSHIYTVTSGNALVSNSLITITGDCILSCTGRSMS